LTNRSNTLSLRLSPPYVGNHVATVGVWRGRWDPFIERHWAELREVVSINKLHRRFEYGSGQPKGRFPGVPVVLKPGETYEADVPLNVAQQICHPEHFGRLWWFAGVGFTEPGRYRVYLQYANLEAVRPFGGSDDDLQQQAQKMVRLDAGEPADLPFQAIVSNPVEFEVLPPKSREPQKFIDLIRQFEVATLVRGDLVTPPPVDRIPAVLDALEDSEVGVRQSLQLTVLRRRVSQLEGADFADELLLPLLEECVNLRRGVPDGPLADAYDLTTCHVLQHLGRAREAADLARRIDTPDAAVFIEETNAPDPP
jgi:hypothetical protein